MPINHQQAGRNVSSAVTQLMDKFAFRSTRPDGNTTNSFHIAKTLTDSNIRAANNLFIRAVRSAFDNEAESDLSNYLLNVSFSNVQMDLFKAAAAVKADDSVTAGFVNLTKSVENICEIQKDLHNNIIREPYIKDLTRIYAEKKTAEKVLKSYMMDGACPQATADDWYSAVKTITSVFSAGKTSDASLTRAFIDMFKLLGYPTFTTVELRVALPQLRIVANTLLQLQNDRAFSKFVERNTLDLSDDNTRDISARTGTLSEEFVWPRVVTALQTVALQAEALEGLNAASEQVRHSVLTLSASGKTKIKPGRHNRHSDTSGTILSSLEKAEILARHNKGVIGESPEVVDVTAADGTQAVYPEDEVISGRFHKLALVSHILLYGDVPLDFFSRSKKISNVGDRPRSNVPAEWFAHYVFIKPAFEEMYAAYLPDPVVFTFYDVILKYAKTSAIKPLVVADMKKELSAAVQHDVTNTVAVILDSIQSLKPIKKAEILDKAFAKRVTYTDQIVTEFDRISPRISQTVDDFLLGSVISVDVNHAIGVQSVPTSGGRGFAEGILYSNENRYGAIDASNTMKEVSNVFNSIQNISMQTQHNLAIELDPYHAVGAAYYDFCLGLQRVSGCKVGPLLASELCDKGDFDLPAKDFYANNVVQRSTRIPLRSGLNEVKHESISVGNIYGTFSYGILEPSNKALISGASISSLFVETAIEILDEVVDNYFPAQVAIKPRKDEAVDLTEENKGYAFRIGEMSNTFSTVNFGKRQELQSLSILPILNGGSAPLFSDEEISRSMHYTMQMRDDVSSLIDLTICKHINAVLTQHHPVVLDLLVRMMTTSLSADQRVLIRRLDISQRINAALGTITSVSASGMDLFKVYYFNRLFNLLDSQLQTPEYVKLIDDGLEPVTPQGAISFAKLED